MLSEKLKTAVGGSASTLYVDDVFSTYLYTGNGSTQTITNGIDLSTNGGMVWIKSRSAATDHKLTDTVRGVTKALISDTTAAQTTDTNGLTAFSSTGFSIGTDSIYNTNAATYTSWSFRKAAKFFDVQTISHTNGTANTIDLSVLGTVGTVIAKITTTTGNWCVWHRSLTAGNNLVLNTTAAQSTTNAYLSVSGTTATLSASAPTGTYVIYAYAHDTASTGIIQCGSYTGSASNVSVTLGWEPQYVMIKPSTTSSGWTIVDSMRGTPVNGQNARLYADASYDEGSGITGPVSPTATGFTVSNTDIGWNGSGQTYIYIAIRRPNKPPTSGTQVFSPITSSATGSVLTSNFPVDMGLIAGRGAVERGINDRLRGFANTDPGASPWLVTQTTAAETLNSNFPSLYAANNTSIKTGSYFGSASAITYLFKRAPTFFDVVCYTGTGVAGSTQVHNLTITPELLIVKCRSNSSSSWRVLYQPSGIVGQLESTATVVTTNREFYFGDDVNYISPTTTNFTVASNSSVNTSGRTYVAYLFATLAGISKVGSYTGNGSTQTINCGFSTGARFVLLKRVDATGDWYTFDTARGMTTLTDPYLLLNSTAAETATLGAVTTTSVGFAINSAILAAINVSGGTYVYLSVA